MKMMTHNKQFLKFVVLVALLNLGACSNDLGSQPSQKQSATDILSKNNDSAAAAVNQYDGKAQVAIGRNIGRIEFFSEKAHQLIDKYAQIIVEANGFNWMEGPLWVERGGFLLFSDVPGNKVYKFKPGEGTSVYLAPSGSTKLYPDGESKGSNGLLLDHDGNLLIMQVGDRRVARMKSSIFEPKEEYETLQSHYQGKRFNSPNDAVLHSSGVLFITDPPYGLSGKLKDPKKELPFQGIFRIDPDGTPTLLDDTLTFPNGIGLSPDEKHLYVAVSDKRKEEHKAAIHVYDLDGQGMVSNKRELVNGTHLLGRPGEQGNFDGLDVHSSGILFATAPGGVWMMTSDGEVLAKIRTFQNTGNCTLTDDEKTLYITADAYLLSVKLK